MALCGLACPLCSKEDCPGCKARGCNEVDCSVFRCITEKGLDGCYQCEVFPCDEKMLQGIRNRAFNRYAKQHGKQALLNRLEANALSGIVYHQPEGLTGNYDLPTTEEDILRLIHFGTHDPYEKCPVLQTVHFTLRLLQPEDAKGLLRCYSDPKALALFNADSCIGDFRCQAIGDMLQSIEGWLKAYEQRAFIRYAIIDSSLDIAIGTIEMFGVPEQNKASWGILRLDLASAYEKQPYIEELLDQCTASFYELFSIKEILTKAVPAAKERIPALYASGFEPYEGPDTGREDYWVRRKE